MKKTPIILSIIAASVIGILSIITHASALPYPTGVGGTGTNITPASGTVLIGNGAGSYTPSFLTPGANIQITNGSGTVTIAVTGTATGTVYLLQGGHGISLSPSSITASGTIAVNTSTVIADVVASGQFLPSSTVYVATVNGQSGAVTIGIPATTTINGTQATVFSLIGDGTTVTSTLNGATTTFSIINTGNWAGTWQGVNSSTFYKASNPSGFISGNQTITLIAAGDATGTNSGTTLITHTITVTGLQGKSLPALATGTLKYTGGAWTFDGNTYLTSGINVTTTAPLGGGGALTSAGLTLTCATCLTANQTITLTGAVTGSGATSIATTYTTSTLYALFSGAAPITFNTSTGAIGWTNSLGYITAITLNGQSGTSFNIVAGQGVTSTVSGATTTITLNLSSGCTGSQFVSTISPTGTISCAIPAGTGGGLTGVGTSTWIPVYSASGTLQGYASLTFTSSTSNLSLNGYLSTTATTTGGQLFDFGGGYVNQAGLPFATPPVGDITTNINAIQGIGMINQSTGTTAEFRFIVQDTGGQYLAYDVPSVNNTSTLFGMNRSAGDFIFNNAGAGITRSLVLGTVSSSSLIFGTNNTERMRVASSGNVGIATTSPATTLDVNGDITDENVKSASVVGTDSTGKLIVTTTTALGSNAFNSTAFLSTAVTSINGATSTSHNDAAGTGISITSTSTNSNSTTTFTNTGVTSFTGQGCVTAANSTGSVTLSVSCISGNQSITFTINGDATGTASGATAITDSITVTGLNGKALPALATGTLEYSGGAWVIKLATSSLGVYDANGNLSSFLGSTCTGGQYVTGISATGTVACGTPAGSGGVSTTTPWTNGSLVIASSGSQIATYAGSNCAAGTYASGVSASGTVTCGTPTGTNNATGTIGAAAFFSATNTITSAPTVQYVPSTYATTGCAGSSTATTWQGCVTAIYQSMAANGGGLIWQTFNVTSTWTGLLSFNINGDRVALACTPGVSLTYTGTQIENTSTLGGGWLPTGANIALNYDFGNPTGHINTSDNPACLIQGNPTLIAAGNSNTATSTGIYYGGTYSFTSAAMNATTSGGAVGVNVGYNINGFGRNLEVGANAYMDSYTGADTGGNCPTMLGCLAEFDVANNSGERNDWNSGTYDDPGNLTSTAAIYIVNSGTALDNFCFNSIDDAQILVGYSNGQVNICYNQIENADWQGYGAYIPIYATSSQATSLNVSGNVFANDATAASTTLGFQTVIKHGVNLDAESNLIANYNGATVVNFSDHSLNNGSESEKICQIQTTNGSGLTNIVAGGGGNTYSQAAGAGCSEDVANSYTINIFANGNNTNSITSGNATVGTFDHTGNWTLGIAGTSGSLNLQGNLNATGTISQSGSAVAISNGAGVNNDCVKWTGANTLGDQGAACGSGGSNNATGTVGYAAYFTATSTLASSTLYGSSTFAIGTTTLPSGYILNAVGSNSSANGGTQIVVQNTASTSFSEFAATADTGSTSTNYVGFGINNSNAATGTENALDGYMESTNGFNIQSCVTGSTSTQCVVRVMISGNAASNTITTFSTTTVKFFQLPIPSAPTLTTSTGGTLASSTYYVKITAVDGNGVETPSSTETSISDTTTTSKVNVSWSAVPGAAYYKAYIATSTNAESLYASTTILSYTFTTTTISNGTTNPTATSTPPTSNNTTQIQIGKGSSFYGGTSTFYGMIQGQNLNLVNPKISTGNNGTVTITGSNPSLNLTNLNDGASAATWQVTYNGQQFGYAAQNNNLYVGQAFQAGNNFIGTTGNGGNVVLQEGALSAIIDDGNGHSGFATTTVSATNGTILGSDSAGLITITTSTTTSTLTFAHAWLLAKPVCQAGIASGTPNYFSIKSTTSTAVITANATLATNTIISYLCTGNPI